MKRDEVIYYIKEELKDFIKNYNNVRNDKARDHKLESAALGIMAMLEGFGMQPPKRPRSTNDVPKEMREYLKDPTDIESWMFLNVPKEVNKWE